MTEFVKLHCKLCDTATPHMDFDVIHTPQLRMKCTRCGEYRPMGDEERTK
jgi:hypothetical protein